MPELPEVETVVRLLRPNLTDRTITGIRCRWPRHVDRPSLDELQDRIIGRVIQDVTRRGKFILFPLFLPEEQIYVMEPPGIEFFFKLL